MSFNKTIYLLLLCLFIKKADSQELFYKTFTWESKPTVTSPQNLDQSEGQLILKDTKIVEYAYEKSGELVAYFTKYRLVKVFSDKGIEQNNKIYIPTNGVLDFMDIKARAISPSGKISMIEKSAIKDVDDAESKGSYKMFAVEGIEKNSEIEYLYTYKKPVNYFGTEFPQSSVPRLNYSFKIISPRNLVYEGKVYNSAEQIKKDTLSEGRHVISISLDKVDLLNEEKYSFYKANLIRFEYKLAYNSVRGAARLFSWDNAADRYYTIFYTPDKKQKSAVENLLKKMKISGSDDAAKARQLEDNLKLKYEIKEGSLEEYENLEKIISNKFGNQTGITKLYLTCLSQMGIKAELVLTCSRIEKKFDPEFDTWNYLDEYFIYLPESKLFMAPNDISSRVGFITPDYTGQKGLFVQEVDLGEGEVKSGIAKIKTIPNTDCTVSNSAIAAEVKFSEDLGSTIISLKQTYTGYAAYYTQPLMNFLSDLQKREFEEKTLKIVGEDASIDNINMSGIAENEILTQPFVLECVLKSSSMLEKAASKYLFKVGLLIGPQAEMYQEGKRKTPPQISYTHMFNRKLSIKIPDGYKLSNIEKLKIDQKCTQADKIMAQFTSDYVLTDNTLEITVVEDYRVLEFPLEKFEDYRKVINAAADFNKIQLVLEKK